MRILVTLHHHLDPNSGAPGTTMALAEAYRRAGVETDVLSFDDLPRGLSHQAQMLAFPLLVASRLTRSLSRWCDIVDSSTGDAWLWTLKRRAGSSDPLLVTRSHGLEHREHLEWLRDHREGRTTLKRRYFLYHGGERLREVERSLRRANLALFLNPDDLDFAVTRLGVMPNRAQLVRHGLDAAFLGLPPPRSEDHSGALRLAVIARHTLGMGAPTYVAALEQLLSRHSQLRVTLLGSAAPATEVRGSFAAGVRERIDVIPAYAHAELPGLLQGHEIIFSAKHIEGYGVALTEGMACGLVPVAARASGPSRIITDGQTGLLVAPRNVDACVEAVERLIADPELRLNLRINAHAAIQDSSWDNVAIEQLQLFESARRRSSPTE